MISKLIVPRCSKVLLNKITVKSLNVVLFNRFKDICDRQYVALCVTCFSNSDSDKCFTHFRDNNRRLISTISKTITTHVIKTASVKCAHTEQRPKTLYYNFNFWCLLLTRSGYMLNASGIYIYYNTRLSS